MSKLEAKYLDWQATLEPSQVYSQPPPPQYPVIHQGRLYYLEQRAAEGGRSVLMRLGDNSQPECLTPPGFNIRSRVHEYGGKSFILHADSVYFSNDPDRRLYRQALLPGAMPRPLTPAGSDAMMIDFCLAADGDQLIFVQEEPATARENVNRICALELSDSGAGQESCAQIRYRHRLDRVGPSPDALGRDPPDALAPGEECWWCHAYRS